MPGVRLFGALTLSPSIMRAKLSAKPNQPGQEEGAAAVGDEVDLAECLDERSRPAASPIAYLGYVGAGAGSDAIHRGNHRFSISRIQ